MTTEPGDLLGRAAELDDLVAHLRRPPGGPSTVVVEGPAGAGRSALVEAAIRRLDVTQIVKAVGHPGPGRARHVLLQQWGVEVEAHDDENIAARLAGAWGSPRVVVVESAEQVPLDTLALVQEAALLTTSAPTVVFVASPMPRIDLPDLHRVSLGGLRLPDVAHLVRSRHHGAGNRAVRAVADLTGGLPGDVLDLLAETPPDVWHADDPAFAATRRHRTWAARIKETVSDQAWAMLQAVSVLDPGGDLACASQLAGVEPDALDPLVALGVVRAGTGHGRTTIHVVHPMTAAAVRDDAGPGAVRALHRRAAELSEVEGDRLAHLVEAAIGPDPDLARDLAVHAAERASAGEWSEAARAYVAASRLTRAAGPKARHLASAVDALVGAGRLPEALDHIAELTTSTSPRTDATLGYLSILLGRQQDAEIRLDRAWQGAQTGALAPVDATLDESVDDTGAGDAGDGGADLRAMVSARQVLHSLVSADGRSLVEWADRAVHHGGPSSVYATEATAIRGLGLGALGRWEEARATFDDALRTVESPAQTQRVTMGRGWLDLAMDDPLAARSAFESVVSADVTHGSTRIVLWAQAWLARTLFVLGRWSECLEVTGRAAHAVEATRHEVVRPLVHWPAAVIHAYRGDLEQAHAHLDAGAASDHDYLAMRLPSAIAHAQVAESQADYTAALRALEPLASGRLSDPDLDPGFWPWRDIYANALVMTGRLAKAQEFLDATAAAATRQGQRSAIARAEVMRGRLHGTRGDIDAALAAFARAETQLTGLPMPLEVARLRFVHGQVLRRVGRRREADEVMRAAREAFGRLGARTYIDRCDRELKASGVERSRASGIGELTPQEATVVELVAAGRTNKEVAGELYISVKTVQYHLTRVYTKLGLRSRSELAAHVHSAAREDGIPEHAGTDRTETDR